MSSIKASGVQQIATSQGRGGTYAGCASWYSGAKTASGEPFLGNAYTGAMHDVPLGSYVSVTCHGPAGSQTVGKVRINDRGPWAVNKQGHALRPLRPNPTRIIDLTAEAFTACAGSLGPGAVPVEITVPPIGLPSGAGGGQVGFGTGTWGLGAVQALEAAWASARMNGNEGGWLTAHPDINPAQGVGYPGISGGGLPVP